MFQFVNCKLYSVEHIKLRHEGPVQESAGLGGAGTDRQGVQRRQEVVSDGREEQGRRADCHQAEKGLRN